MGKRHRLSISFKQQFYHVYEHLQSIPNRSDFIAKALEAYISGGHLNTTTHEDIRAIVLEVLQKQGNLSPMFVQDKPLYENDLSDEEAELINQLF